MEPDATLKREDAMKKTVKRLTLNRETLRRLWDEPDLPPDLPQPSTHATLIPWSCCG